MVSATAIPMIPRESSICDLLRRAHGGIHHRPWQRSSGEVVTSPALKVCGNPKTYARMSGDMDVNAGRIIAEGATLLTRWDKRFST